MAGAASSGTAAAVTPGAAAPADDKTSGGPAAGATGAGPTGGTGGGDASAGAVGAKVEEFKPTIPEGVQVDEALLTDFAKAVKEEGISAKAAQKVLDSYLANVKRVQDALPAQQKAAHEERVAGWEKAIKGDKALGGPNYEATMGNVTKALAQSGLSKEEVERDFVALGLHRYPPLVKLLSHFGARNNEDGTRQDDKPLPGGGASPSAREAEKEQKLQTFRERLYNHPTSQAERAARRG